MSQDGTAPRDRSGDPTVTPVNGGEGAERTASIGVFVVDRDLASIEAARRIIEGAPGLIWIGAHVGTTNFVASISEGDPDVVVLDPSGFPDPLAAVRLVCFSGCRAGVVLYAPELPPHLIDVAMGIGARGFVCKSSPPVTLTTAILGVAAGHLVIGAKARKGFSR